MKKENFSVNQFYNLATDHELNPKHPMILCSCATFFSKHKLYLMTGVLLTIVDEGLIKGRPRLVINNNLNILTKEIDTTIGLGENIHTLAHHVTKVKEIIDSECGLHSHIKVPCLEMQKLYQILTVNDDIDVHLFKSRTTKNKYKRCQMASTPVRNLASHIGPVTYSNFRPVTGKWIHHRNLGKGSIMLIKMTTDITGAHIKPIFPAFILNKDDSSQYYFTGTI